MRIAGLIGVVHLRPLPGDAKHDGGGFGEVFDAALKDAHALASGCDAILVENFGSVPFAKGTAGARLDPHVVASMGRIARACKDETGLLVGVNCLRNDARAAIGIAAALALDFVRINVHTGVYASDQGLLEGEAHDTLRYRKQLGAESVAICADVHVKHAAPLVAQRIEVAAQDCELRGLADALIVTGEATGATVLREDLTKVAAAVDTPVLIGSGLTARNAAELCGLADGAIVGSFFRNGDLRQPVAPARVGELRAALAGGFRNASE